MAIMKTIYKYQLQPLDRQLVPMPNGAQILTVQMQGEHPCVWAMVDIDKPVVVREIRMYGTGHPIDHDPGRYIGTIQMRGGQLIFHFFEVTE